MLFYLPAVNGEVQQMQGNPGAFYEVGPASGNHDDVVFHVLFLRPKGTTVWARRSILK